uniref:CWH43-like N-terminal domain-containing protein n=1 Tax=Caenorhabditis japonica TaxID=281687 RepID=A0A8R1EMM7_CAEJA
MPTYQFEAARGPVIIGSLPLKLVFQWAVSMPGVGVVIAFIIGYTIHTSLMYDYEWVCRKVYLPSVSRLLNLPLERIAWNILSLASVPLQLFVVMRQYILTFSTSPKQQYLRIVLVISSVFQSLFLTLLATVGERESGG